MNVTKETVTPKKAMEWLKRNVHNRPLSTKVATKYAAMMRDGRWKLNGETIKFNGNGDLIDGQHRLTGCIEAAAPFESYVVRGLPHEAFDSIDQGTVRTTGHVLARRGEKNYNVLAAAAGLLWRLTTNGDMDHDYARTDQASECIEANPGLRDSVQYACDNRTSIVSKSVVAGLRHAFASVDAKASYLFWDRVIVGEGLTRDMPEFRLRTRLIDNSRSSAKLPRRDIVALCIKAWNLCRSNKTVKTLAFFEREDFPRIDGFKYAE